MESTEELSGANTGVVAGGGSTEEGTGTDSLRAALEKTFAESTKASADEGKPAAATAEAAKTSEPGSEQGAPAAAEAATANAPAATEPQIPERLKAKLAAKWATLDPEVRAEFLGYESHVGRLAHRYGQAAKQWEAMEQVIAPYMGLIKAENGTPHRAAAQLFETARVLRQGSPDQKLNLVRQMVQAYQIPAQVSEDGSLVLGQARSDPATLARLSELEAQDLTGRATAEYNVRQEVSQELDAFLADPSHSNVAHPGYTQLMAQLISSGVAKDLADAYQRAEWLHDSTRDSAIARANAARAQSAAAATQAAQAAAVSVKGNSVGNPKRDPSKMDLRQTLVAVASGELT